MAHRSRWAVAAALLLLTLAGSAGAEAQTQAGEAKLAANEAKPAQGPGQRAMPAAAPPTLSHPRYSAECSVKRPAFEGRRAFRAARKALKERRIVKVLAIGSSSIVGLGASSPLATFPHRLELDLETALKGADFDIVGSGVSGEMARATAERLKLEVAERSPDLVVWQVGTNDAMARVDPGALATLLAGTLSWLAAHGIDVILVDPQYVERLARDQHYVSIVRAITEVARQSQVPLVHRYDAMEDLATSGGNRAYLAKDQFHLNDLGYRCMAEYVARAIETGIAGESDGAAGKAK